MDNDFLEEQQVPSGLLIGIKFDVSTEEDMVSNFFFFYKFECYDKCLYALTKTEVILDFHFSCLNTSAA